MPTRPQWERVLLVLSPSPVRTMLRAWLDEEGYRVTDARPWEVDDLLDRGSAGVLVTSGDLDGEWGWSERRPADAVVLALRRPAVPG
jgi:hypothetical protein